MSCDEKKRGEVVPLASALKSRNNYCQECSIPAWYPLPPWSKQTCNIRTDDWLNNDGNTPGYSDHVYVRMLPALPCHQTGVLSVGVTTMLATFSQPIANESGDRESRTERTSCGSATPTQKRLSRVTTHVYSHAGG